MLSLKEKYTKEVIPLMKEKFGHKNVMSVPKIEKVVVNTGFGKFLGGKTKDEQRKTMKSILNDLATITGQKPVLTKAKKSIAIFKLREGTPVGASVTLRRKKMYAFLERLIHVSLARSRDFQGINLKSIDDKGNLTIGIKEHIIFPEILPENIRNSLGLEATIVTTADSKEEGLELFKLLGFPMEKKKRI